MILKIDLSNKTIELEDSVLLKDLVEHLTKLFGDTEWKDYKLIPKNTSYVGYYPTKLPNIFEDKIPPVTSNRVVDIIGETECHCSYSKAMNQPYPRLCVKCGKPEEIRTVDKNNK